MEEFFRKLEINPLYSVVLPITTSLHRFEKQHQDYSKPRIFLKELDESGFTRSFEVNKIYRKIYMKEVDKIMEDLNEHASVRIDEGLSWLKDADLYSKISALVKMDRAEYWLYSQLKKVSKSREYLVDEMPPIIERVYDDGVIPVTGYKFNDKIIKVSFENDLPRIDINGLPISFEDSENLDIDDLLSKLIK